MLQTGGGEPLVTGQQVLQTQGVLSPAVVFDFGFFSNEVLAPGAFLDSFSVSIQDSSMAIAVLVTADASGVVWSPSSQGAVVIADSAINRIGIPPPNMSPVLGQGNGFSVSMILPAQFTGPEVTVYFDLFDNLDQVMSLGWYYEPRVISSVPEPQSVCLLALGLFFAALRKKRAA